MKYFQGKCERFDFESVMLYGSDITDDAVTMRDCSKIPDGFEKEMSVMDKYILNMMYRCFERYDEKDKRRE